MFSACDGNLIQKSLSLNTTALPRLLTTGWNESEKQAVCKRASNALQKDIKRTAKGHQMEAKRQSLATHYVLY